MYAHIRRVHLGLGTSIFAFDVPSPRFENLQLVMVLIPKKTRKAILEHLFKEGVMVVKNDPRAKHHNELEDIPNLHVMTHLYRCNATHGQAWLSQGDPHVPVTLLVQEYEPWTFL